MEQPYLRFKTDDGSEYPAWEREDAWGVFYRNKREESSRLARA